MKSHPSKTVTRLYHFTQAKYALDDLKYRRLKIASLNDLNDPFELRCVNLANPVHAMAFEGTEKSEGFVAAMAQRYGVLCFSEDKFDILQWAHYAEQHKGICLGFDVSGAAGMFGHVKYVASRYHFPEQLDQAFMWKLLSTKFKASEPAKINTSGL
jgi:hypothetical protein